MQGIQPQQLTDKELVNYVDLYGIENLPKEWAIEVAKRFMELAQRRV